MHLVLKTYLHTENGDLLFLS